MNWKDLSYKDKLKLLLRAASDPVFFWEHPLLGNFKLWDSQKKILQRFYERNQDGSRKYTELILVCGFKSGKTTIASLISMYEVFLLLESGDPQKKFNLPAGTEIFVVNVATSSTQALDTVFAQCRARIENSPYFQRQKYTKFIAQHLGEFRFDHNIVVRAIGSNASSAVGRTVKVVCFDELAKFVDNKGRRSSSKVYESLAAQTDVFKPYRENIKIITSSPEYEGDFVLTLYDQAIKEKWDGVLAMQLPTWEMNPNLPREVLKDEETKNPEAFWRDFGAKPIGSRDNFFSQEILDELEKASTRPNCFQSVGPSLEILQTPDFEVRDYVLSGDPALRNDAFGFCLGGWKNDQIYIQGIGRFKPEGSQISASEVRSFVMRVLKTFPVSQVVFDTWYFPELQEEISAQGIPVVNNVASLKEYTCLREQIYMHRLSLPHCPELFDELRKLLVIKNRRIDHPSTGSKDLSDALANCVWMLTQEKPEVNYVTGLLKVI